MDAHTLHKKLENTFPLLPNGLFSPSDWWFLPDNRKCLALIYYDKHLNKIGFTQEQVLCICQALTPYLKAYPNLPLLLANRPLGAYFVTLTYHLMGTPHIILYSKTPESEMASIIKAHGTQGTCDLETIENRVLSDHSCGLKSAFSFAPWAPIRAHKAHLWLNTSGTTGSPKLCPTGHALSLRANVLSSICFFASSSGSSWCPMEVAWGAVSLNAVRQPLCFAQPMVLAQTSFNLARQETQFILIDAQVKCLFLTPFYLRSLREFKQRLSPFVDIERVTFAGERCTEDDKNFILELFPNALILNAYGNNETGCVSFLGAGKQPALFPASLKPMPLTKFEVDSDHSLILYDTQRSFWSGYKQPDTPNSSAQTHSQKPYNNSGFSRFMGCYVTDDQVEADSSGCIVIKGRRGSQFKWKGKVYHCHEWAEELQKLCHAQDAFVVYLDSPTVWIQVFLWKAGFSEEDVKQKIFERWGLSSKDLHVTLSHSWPQTTGGKVQESDFVAMAKESMRVAYEQSGPP